ncbi:hypothetical protein F-VV57_0304 [Faustovirus]|nr:hypothetical protein F-VV57_0304 [Faustovirus]QJX73572.1 hypothetical protein F-VV63_0306 [Faustovirus]
MPNSRRKSKSSMRGRRSKTKSRLHTRKQSHKQSHKQSRRHSRGSTTKHTHKSKSHSKRRSTKANPDLWRKSVKKAMHRFNDKRSSRMYQNAVQIYKSEGGKFRSPKSPDNSLQRWSAEHKDEPKSLKSKVNRILKNDSGRMRMMRKFA